MGKKKIIASSILSLAMCASVITGATFSLATSNSEVNIAVQAGNVNVTATLGNLKTFSAQANADNSGYDEVAQTEGATETFGTFVNGGTAEIKDGTLTLDRMIHGDKATFDIVFDNQSNIDIQYQTVIQTIEDTGLFSGLVIEIDGQSFNGVTAVSEWEFLKAHSPIEKNTWTCSVSLPIDAESEYQGKFTKLSVSVNAVQGNAIVGTSVYTEDDFTKAIEDQVDTIVLAKDIVLNESQSLTENQDVTIIGQGNKISRAKQLSGNLFNVDETSSLTLQDVTVDGGAQDFEIDMGDYPSIKNDSLEDVIKITEPVIVSYGDIVVDNCTFADNYCDGFNSPVQVLAGTAEFNNCNFEHNYSPNSGAAVGVGVDSSEVTEYAVKKAVFNNCEFNGNFAQSGTGGGALYIVNTEEVYIQSCKFINNCAMGYNCGGGAIFFGRNGAYAVQNSLNNEGADDLAYVKAYIDDCLFEGNHSGNDGAAIHSECADLYITNSKFINNYGNVGTISCMPYADASDGANPTLFLNCTIDDCEFIGNSVAGGAIFGNHATAVRLTLTNSIAKDNKGICDLLIYEGEYNTIKNCKFEENELTKAVFDIRTADERDAEVTIENVTITSSVPGVMLDAQQGHNATCYIQGETTAQLTVKTTNGTSKVIIDGVLNGDIDLDANTPEENVVKNGTHDGKIIKSKE